MSEGCPQWFGQDYCSTCTCKNRENKNFVLYIRTNQRDHLFLCDYH